MRRFLRGWAAAKEGKRLGFDVGGMPERPRRVGRWPGSHASFRLVAESTPELIEKMSSWTYGRE